jgi:hypothetical protein
LTLEFSGIIVSHQVFVQPKIERLRTSSHLKAATYVGSQPNLRRKYSDRIKFLFTYVKLQKIQAWKLECEKQSKIGFQEKRKKQNVNLELTFD